MNKPDAVLRELGQLYELYRELEKFRLKRRPEPDPSDAPVAEGAPPAPRSGAGRTGSE